MMYYPLGVLLLIVDALLGNAQEEKDSRVADIADSYSRWALSGKSVEYHQPQKETFEQIHVPKPLPRRPRYYNKGPIKEYRHTVRIQPPPLSPTLLMRNPNYRPAEIRRKQPMYFQQQVQYNPGPQRSFFETPAVLPNPNFPQLIARSQPLPPMRSLYPTLFPMNASSFPSHMGYHQNVQHYPTTVNSGPLIPSDEPSALQPPSPPPPHTTFFPIVTQGQSPNVYTQAPMPPSVGHVPRQELFPLATPQPENSAQGGDARLEATKKHKFGLPRFIPMLPPPPPMHPQQQQQPSFQPFFFSQPSCSSGWCGNDCCPSPTTTIQATAHPGSPTPPHPLVLVVHPPPTQNQCSPACQPMCHPQCVSRMHIFPENNYYNMIQEPNCRPDCMPMCHMDCLIMPPERVRCPTFHCQCSAGYVQCAAFTCCMRYKNMAARMRSASEQEVAESSSAINGTAGLSLPQFQRHHSPAVTSTPSELAMFSMQGTTTSTALFPSTATTTEPALTTTTLLSTTTTTTESPTTTSMTVMTTPTTEEPPSTTTISKESVSSVVPVLTVTPIYPDMEQPRGAIPLVPAYDLWQLRPDPVKVKEAPQMEPESKDRHVIRSENFLDMLTELAQVKMKEDISEDIKHAKAYFHFLTENI